MVRLSVSCYNAHLHITSSCTSLQHPPPYYVFLHLLQHPPPYYVFLHLFTTPTCIIRLPTHLYDTHPHIRPSCISLRQPLPYYVFLRLFTAPNSLLRLPAPLYDTHLRITPSYTSLRHPPPYYVWPHLFTTPTSILRLPYDTQFYVTSSCIPLRHRPTPGVKVKKTLHYTNLHPFHLRLYGVVQF
jgi:hypothetical protein